MINTIKKVPFPDFLLTTDCKVSIYDDSIDENGNHIEKAVYIGKCIFSEKNKRIISPDGQRIDLSGKIIVKGDINPDYTISNGEVSINEKKYNIYSASRPRNPDGTIHHTTLDLI